MNSVKQSNQIKHYMHRYSFLILLSAVIAIGLAKNVAASQISVHEKIENEIHSYIKAKIDKSPDKKTEIIISPIDRRKKLSFCNNNLSIALASKNGLKRNNTVSVACNGAWRIFVPVKVKTLSPVVTARKNLAVGEFLNQQNLEIKYIDTSLVIGPVVYNIEDITGSKVKRYIQGGRPLLANLICMVCKGEQVNVIAKNGKLQIKSTGLALNDGSRGQKISIKNNSSGRIIEATVMAVGQAEINLKKY